MFVLVVMMMLMLQMRVLGFLLFAVHLHGDVRAGDAALDGRFLRDGHAGDAEVVQLCDKSVRIGEKLGEGSREHIARRAHAAVEI